MFHWKFVTLIACVGLSVVLGDHEIPYARPANGAYLVEPNYVPDDLHDGASRYAMSESGHHLGSPVDGFSAVHLDEGQASRSPYELQGAPVDAMYQQQHFSAGDMRPSVMMQPLDPMEYEQQHQLQHQHQHQHQHQQQILQNQDEQLQQQQHPRRSIGVKLHNLAKIAHRNIARAIDEARPHASELKSDVSGQFHRAVNSPTVATLKKRAEPYLRRTASFLGHYASRGARKVQNYANNKLQPRYPEDQQQPTVPTAYAAHAEQVYPPPAMQSQVQLGAHGDGGHY